MRPTIERMKNLKRLAPALLGALLLTGCASAPTGEEATMTQTVCIISGEPAEGGPSADYLGQSVNFCCDRCKSKWDGMDAAARKAAFDSLK